MRHIIFTTQTHAGRESEDREYSDDVTDQEIKDEFLDWLYTVAEACWTEEVL